MARQVALIDEAGLKAYRKRVPLGQNFEALEFARSLGINVAINLIVDLSYRLLDPRVELQ